MRFIAVLFLIFNSGLIYAETLTGRVVSVHDGDTVTLLQGKQQIKVRLAQIDAPELDQAFGRKSKQSLSDMVFKKAIRVEKQSIDQYGRTVGTLFINNLDVNREQVKRGMAWVYRQYLHDQSLLKDENLARQTKKGLWSQSNPLAPWDYRQKKR